MSDVKKDDRIRRRLSFSPSDTQIVQWIDAQSDLTNSVRYLIRESIKKHGVCDVYCLPVQENVRVGRPPKKKSGAPEEEVVHVYHDEQGPIFVAASEDEEGGEYDD